MRRKSPPVLFGPRASPGHVFLGYTGIYEVLPALRFLTARVPVL